MAENTVEEPLRALLAALPASARLTTTEIAARLSGLDHPNIFGALRSLKRYAIDIRMVTPKRGPNKDKPINALIWGHRSLDEIPAPLPTMTDILAAIGALREDIRTMIAHLANGKE